MKKKIFSILFAIALALSLGLLTAVPAGAQGDIVFSNYSEATMPPNDDYDAWNNTSPSPEIIEEFTTEDNLGQWEITGIKLNAYGGGILGGGSSPATVSIYTDAAGTSIVSGAKWNIDIDTGMGEDFSFEVTGVTLDANATYWFGLEATGNNAVGWLRTTDDPYSHVFELTGNPTGVPPPVEVWVDDGFTEATPGWGQTHFATIQDGINAVAEGGTVTVAAGTYAEAVTIDKSLTLQGAGSATTTVIGAHTITANDVIVDGFTLDGGITLDDLANTISGGTISNNLITNAQNGIRVGFDSNGKGVDGVTIEDNTIINNIAKGIRFSNTKIGDKGPQRISNITISGNEIKDNGSAGIETYGPGLNTIINNSISGNDGNGINLKFDDGDVVTGNTITNNTGPGITMRQVTNTLVEKNSVSGHQSQEVIKTCDTVIGGKGSGIHIFDTSEDNTIRFNDISGNNYGIFIHSKDGLQPSSNSITYNNIAGNINYGILNALVDPLTSVDATNNWWGKKGGGAIKKMVSDNVDYVPWLDAAYDTGESFAPVNNITRGTMFSSIQAAIDDTATVAGDTINVAAGTYKEHITIDKSNLRLMGEDKQTTIIDATQDSSWPVAKPGILIGEYPLVDGVQGVTISGFTIKDVARQEGGVPYAGDKYGVGPQALAGILIYNGSNNTIENNILINNYWQIFLCAEWPAAGYTECMNNRIANNVIQNSENDGVYLYSDGGVFLEGTEIIGNEIDNADGDAASGVEFWGWPEGGGTPTISSTVIERNLITGCTYGVRIREDVSDITGTSLNFNNFADNSIQVLDATETLDIQGVLDTNTFDRAVVVDHASLLHTIWSSIQDGIDAAVSGDTIKVAAGEYDETITFTASFAINNLSIQGNVANRPVVTGGVHFGNSTPITDLSLENLYLKGDGSGGTRNHIVDMKQPQISGEVNNFTMANCVIDGENNVNPDPKIGNRHGICGRHFGQDFTITNTEFKNVLGWALMDIHSGSGDGASSLPFATVTFANNNIHDCNGSIALRGHATTKTTTVNAYGNTFTNIGGNEGEVGQHWAALEINHAVTANVYDNTVNGVSESEWGEGQAFQFWDIDTLNVYGNDITNNYQGIFIYGGEAGGTYGGPYAIPDGSISFNNIVGNDQYGIEVGANATGGPLNAKNNWWGKKGGGAIKKMVSGNVDYDPWIGAKAKNSKSQKTKTGGVTVDAKHKTDTDVLKKGKGTPTITVTEYTDNPGDGAPGGFSSVGKYIDVHLDDTTDVDEIEIRNYYTLEDIAELDEATLKLSWWNGTAWIECSDSGATYPDGGPTYRGYVWAKIRADTIPTLDDMAGTAFMSMGRPPAPLPPPSEEGPMVPPPPPPGTTDVRGRVNTAGRFWYPVTAISEDELCTLTIPRGTVGLTEELEPLTEITMLIMDEPPSPPEDTHIIGLTYDFEPSGATFDPAITLTWSYDPADIPEDVAEEDLVLTYYDETAGEWVELEGCVVDTENNTITAPVSHFTTFAIVGAVPPPPPLPAAFSVTNLSIQPIKAKPLETVTIAVSVANTGGTEGSYSVVLKINGVKEAEKVVTVAAGSSEDVSFSVTREEVDSYSVTMDGLSGSFTIAAPPVPPPPVPVTVPPAKAPINWPILGGIIGGVVVVGVGIFFLIRRKAA